MSSSSLTMHRPMPLLLLPTGSQKKIRAFVLSITRRIGNSAAQCGQDSLPHKEDIVLYTDADLPFDLNELPRIVRLLREYEADIVSAYRFDRTGEGAPERCTPRSTTR